MLSLMMLLTSSPTKEIFIHANDEEKSNVSQRLPQVELPERRKGNGKKERAAPFDGSGSGAGAPTESEGAERRGQWK